jgi:LAO/AO transport system kinase
MSRTQPLPPLTERILAGDRAVLGRAVSIAENGGDRWEQLQKLLPPAGSAAVVGFTGGAGSGKSTLIDAMIVRLRERDLKVGVAAIDPSSPFSGGAVLGDRCRMNRHQGDPGVFIRSLSARGSVGGLSAGAGRVIDLLRCCGFDLLLIETVGAGQSEVDILELADICIVISTPNSGDDIQAIKSGILEIADVLVVNKMDLAGADRAMQQLKLAQNLPSNISHKVQVIPTVATEGTGTDTLIDAILDLANPSQTNRRGRGDMNRVRRRIAHAVSTELEQRLVNSAEEGLDHLCCQVLRGECSVEEAARVWLDKKFL